MLHKKTDARKLVFWKVLHEPTTLHDCYGQQYSLTFVATEVHLLDAECRSASSACWELVLAGTGVINPSIHKLTNKSVN